MDKLAPPLLASSVGSSSKFSSIECVRRTLFEYLNFVSIEFESISDFEHCTHVESSSRMKYHRAYLSTVLSNNRPNFG